MEGKKVYVSVYSRVAKDVLIRGCPMELPDDYDMSEDAGKKFPELRRLFYRAIQDYCTCRYQYDQFLPEYTTVVGITQLS